MSVQVRKCLFRSVLLVVFCCIMFLVLSFFISIFHLFFPRVSFLWWSHRGRALGKSPHPSKWHLNVNVTSDVLRPPQCFVSHPAIYPVACGKLVYCFQETDPLSNCIFHCLFICWRTKPDTQRNAGDGRQKQPSYVSPFVLHSSHQLSYPDSCLCSMYKQEQESPKGMRGIKMLF